MRKTGYGIFLAVLAASLYALNAPLSKLVLNYLPSTLTAGFLYLGAGVGMFLVGSIKSFIVKESKEEKLAREDLPYTIAMILLDVLAPILLLLGLSMTTPENTSLLNNFEIVATAVIALCFFKEKISKRLWLGIILITLSCGILSFENILSLKFSIGSLFVVLASLCWGIENNCTRKLSNKDPLQIVVVKGVCSGLTSIIIGLGLGQKVMEIWAVFVTLGIGFVAYGLSIFFYVYAQRILGASRTSAYYAVAPFIGVLLSLVIFKSIPTWSFFIALAFMAIGAWLCSKDEPILKKKTTTK